MPYSTLPTVNPGDVISSSSWGNQIKTNEDYLFNGRPGQAINRNNVGDYTTTSTSFVNVDNTNLAITATISSGTVIIAVTATAFNAAGNSMYFDLEIDGVREGGTDGLIKVIMTNPTNVSFTWVKTGLSVGSHTFKLQWKVTASAGHLQSNSADCRLGFSVKELG